MTDVKKGDKPYAQYSRNVHDRKNAMPMILGGIALAIVVIGVVAFLLTRSEDKSDTAGAGTGAEAAKDATQETASVTISGEDLPVLNLSQGQLLGAPGEDPAVGMEIPKLAGQTFDGSDLTIDPADGKPKVILFLAHWCPHCQREVPKVGPWIAKGGLPEGVDAYAVATGTREDYPNYPPSAWLRKEKWPTEVLADSDDAAAAQAFGLSAYPFFVLVDEGGKVVDRFSGEIDLGELQAKVDGLVAE